MSALEALILVAALAILIAVALAVWCRHRAIEPWLPRELRDARLCFAETSFESRKDIRIKARIDRAYILKGTVYLVELKVRSARRAYFTDVIELSAQRVAVQESTGLPVSRVAYVVVTNAMSKKRTAVKVHLLGQESVQAIAERREALLLGLAQAKQVDDSRKCHDCEFRNGCNPSMY